MKAYNKKCKPKHATKTKCFYWLGGYVVTNYSKTKSVFNAFMQQQEKVGRYQQNIL